MSSAAERTDPTEYRLKLVKNMLDAAAEELAALLCDLKRGGQEAADPPTDPEEGTP